MRILKGDFLDIQVNDLTVLLVLTFPMFIFTIFPALKLGDFLEKKYSISENQKNAILPPPRTFGADALALFLKYY